MRWLCTIAILFFGHCQGLGQSGADDSSSDTSTKLLLRTHILMGDSSLSKGDLPQAEKEYLQAYLLIEEVLKKKQSHRIGLFNETIFDPIDRLGQLYILTNNLTKAEVFFKMSQKLRDVHLPQKSLFRVPPLVGLGQVYFQRGDYEMASEVTDQAEDILNSSFTGWYNYEHYGKSIYTPKFEIALQEKRYKEAEKYLSRLSTGATITMDKNVQANIPRVFDMRARYHLHTGDYEQATKNLNKAEEFSEAIDNELIKFQVERTKALLLWSENDISSASHALIRLTGWYRKYIEENFAAMTEYEREGFFAKLRYDFDLFNAFAVQNRTHKIAPVLFQEVYNNQLFSKALLLNHINRQKEQIIESGDEKLIQLLGDWEKEKDKLSALYYQKKPSPEQIKKVENNIYQLEQEINNKSDFLSTMTNRVSWQQVQNELSEGESAMEIIRVKNYTLQSEKTSDRKYQFTKEYVYLALILSANGNPPAFFVISDGNRMEGNSLNIYRNSILHKLEDKTSYNTYWKPLSDQLKSAHKVYLSADGVYNQINLNSLQNMETGAYVLDEIELSLVTNTKDLVLAKTDMNRKKATLLGRPQYLVQTDKLPTISNEQASLSGSRAFDSKVFDQFREQVFTDLPGTEKEVKSIENILEATDWQVDAKYGTEATEGQLKKSINPAILHIATHGFFLQQDNFDGVNSMIRSGLILSGVDKTNLTSTDDGVLTAYEATNLKLDSTYLVVLSACETGLGEIKNGEGVYGLQRGFAVAGVRYVLMSLWKVDDFATQALMQAFYKKWLGGMEIHEAFAQAQIELRGKHPHPFYWGAFILLGN